MTSIIESLIEKQSFVFDSTIDTDSLILDDEDIIIEINNQKINIQSSKDLHEGNKHRISLVLPYIINAIQKHSKPVKFIFSIGDILEKDYGKVPAICFSKKKDVNGILIPNIDFFTGVIYNVLNASNNDMNYFEKQNASIFVGSSTGPLKNNTRVLYGSKCLKSTRHKCIISNLCQADQSEWINDYPYILDLVSQPMTIKEQLQNKIVVNIDGNTVCWSRLYWQMNSNSIPVYIDKNTNDIQLFDYLDSNGAYISSNLDQSITILDSILDSYSDKQILEINECGQEFCNKNFKEYINNPQNFLQNIINSIFDKILVL